MDKFKDDFDLKVDEQFTVSFTGHRPDKLGGWSKSSTQKVIDTASKAIEIIEPDHGIVGMAVGWDMAVAEALIKAGVPFTAAIPFKGQHAIWNAEDQNRYFKILDKAAVTVYVSPPPFTGIKMMRRNEWMVDNSHCLVALYNGDQGGGTVACVRYSMSKKKPVFNAWRIFTNQSDCLTEMLASP